MPYQKGATIPLASVGSGQFAARARSSPPCVCYRPRRSRLRREARHHAEAAPVALRASVSITMMTVLGRPTMRISNGHRLCEVGSIETPMSRRTTTKPIANRESARARGDKTFIGAPCSGVRYVSNRSVLMTAVPALGPRAPSTACRPASCYSRAAPQAPQSVRRASGRRPRPRAYVLRAHARGWSRTRGPQPRARAAARAAARPSYPRTPVTVMNRHILRAFGARFPQCCTASQSTRPKPSLAAEVVQRFLSPYVSARTSVCIQVIVSH
jgi:hypothetical protein